MIDRLHYISQATAGKSHVQHITEACAAGVKWVQLRVKDQPDEEVEEIARQARQVCTQYGARLIVNDFVEIAHQVNADGVHLGKQDASPEYAREILGPQKIIGGTANTFDDILSLTQGDVDYIGLGPFRFTSTKQNLSPVLGLAGYTSLLDQMKKQGISQPVVAIGGIEVADIAAIADTGVHGVAIASLINEAADKKEIVNQLLKELSDEKFNHSRAGV